MARSSAARNQASSPPGSSAGRQSQSPVGRRTRSTRSQSADLGNADGMIKKRSGKRGVRQASVDSVGSNASLASSRGTRSKKAAAPAVAYPDLSTLAEDDEELDNEEDDDEDAIQNIEVVNPRSNSPGALSQMSGTTAITSHSVGEIAKLDPMMAEILPDLLESSYKVMDLLAPKGATEQDIEKVVRELKIPGSRRAKHLRHHEERFRTTKDNYGSDKYIRAAFVLRKLLGTEDPGEGSFRPDPIIYAANLATLVTDFLVMQKESQSTRITLQGTTDMFPQAFLESFEEDLSESQSEALEQSFDVALQLHVQYVIAYLAFMNEGEERVPPQQVLASHFYESLLSNTDPSGSLEQLIEGGLLKNILRPGQTYSKEQEITIMETLGMINNTFRQSEDARELGDLVDFDELEKLFPWRGFLASLAQWSRLRLQEISETIKQQGGVEEITRSLIELIKNNDSQVDIQYDPPASATRMRELLPAANITSSNRNSFNSSANIQLLQQLKQQTVDPTSSKGAHTNAQASSSRTQARSKQASSITAPKPVRKERSPQPYLQVDNDYRPAFDDGEEGNFSEQPRPTGEYVASWTENLREGNKENLGNRPVAQPALKRRLIDRQDNAERVEWNSQDSMDGQPAPKRARSEPEENEEESEDQGFEQDARQVPARKTAAPPADRHASSQAAPTAQRQPPASRRSVSPQRERSNAAARRAQPRPASRARPRRVIEDDEDSDDVAPAPTATQIGEMSRAAGVLARQATRRVQVRVPWSEADEATLVAGIEEHGCSWSFIHEKFHWEHRRDQVALKDKARNLKVLYLRSNIELPDRFDEIRLGKKEVRSVQQVIPDYEQDPEDDQ